MTSPDIIASAAAHLDALALFVESAAAFASKVVAAAAVLAALLPQPGQASPLAPLRKILDWAAFNVGHAENKKDAG
jgi:hypothetical protein